MRTSSPLPYVLKRTALTEKRLESFAHVPEYDEHKLRVSNLLGQVISNGCETDNVSQDQPQCSRFGPIPAGNLSDPRRLRRH